MADTLFNVASFLDQLTTYTGNMQSQHINRRLRSVLNILHMLLCFTCMHYDRQLQTYQLCLQHLGILCSESVEILTLHLETHRP